MAQELRIKISGLYTYPSDLSAVPPGALITADNIVLDQDSVAAPRRGYNYLYYTSGGDIHQAQFPLSTQRANKYFFYQGNALAHYDVNLLAWFDPAAGWTPFSGTYLPVCNQTTGTMTSGSTAVTSLGSSQGLVVGQAVFGAGIALGTFIAAFTASTLTMSQPATSNESGTTLTFVVVKVRDVQANQNHYFTTNAGLLKQTSYSAKPTLAGVPQALNVVAALATGTVTTAGSYTTNQTVLTVSSTAGLGINMVNDGSTNIPTGAVITDLTATTITISLATTGSGSNAVFIVPTTAVLNAPALVSGIYTYPSVYYRVVWSITDANQNLIFGSPSQPVLVYNWSAAGATANLTITVPGGITTAHMCSIYRSFQATTTAAAGPTSSAYNPPNDTEYLTWQGNPSSADISQGYLTVCDPTPENLLTGGELYTNADQQGSAFAYLPLPQAKDVTVWRGCTFLANTVTLPSFTVNLLGCGAPTGLQVNDTLTVGNVTYTASSSEVIGSDIFEVFGQFTSAGVTCTTNGSTTLSSVSSTTGLYVGILITGSGVLPNNTFVTGISGSTVFLSQTALTSTTGQGISWSTTAEQAINLTCASIVNVVNRSTLSTVTAQYLNDNPALGVGSLLFTAKAFDSSGNSFAINASPRPCWGQGIATAVQRSNNSAAKNGLQWSVPNQPESFPLAYSLPVGSAAANILRIIALRDSLIILKEDGIFIMTGTDPTNFLLRPLDYTAILIAPESAVLLNNQIYCLTTQGVVTVSELGPPIISHPIEGSLLTLMTQNLPLLAEASFGIAYESDRAYWLYMPTFPTDPGCTQYFRWNYITNTWTHGTLSKTCGAVNPATNQLWLGDFTLNITSIENKTLTYADYADYQSTQTISAISMDGYTYTISEADTLSEGDVLWQSSTSFVQLLSVDRAAGTCVVALPNPGMVTGSCDVLAPINVTMTWAPIVLDNPGLTKQIWEGTLIFLAGFQGPGQVGFVTDVSPSQDTETISGGAIGPFGLFGWGGPSDYISGNIPNTQGALWGGSPARGPIRFSVTRNHQRCTLLEVSFLHNYAYSPWQLQGVSLIGNIVSERTAR